MKRSFLRYFRSLLQPSRRPAHRRQHALDCKFFVEQLEPRLVLAVQLASGPLPDLVTVSPSPTLNQFDVTTDQALPAKTTTTSTAISFDGQTLYQTTAANFTIQSANFVPVDPTKTYGLSGWARSGDEFGIRYQPNNQQSFGFTSYDKDHLEILPQHVLRYTGSTDTTLALPLNPGDTAIRLTNAAGWSNGPGAPAATRGIAWYGYHDSSGTTYADYSYTRNIATGGANGLWAPGAIGGNVIQLASPWSGPALPAGAAVRDIGAGSESNFAALDSQPVPGDWTWTKYTAIFGAQVLQSGMDSLTQFRPGTAFIRPTIVSNEQGGTANLVSWGNVLVSEVPPGTTAAGLASTIIDLSLITGGNQRQAFTPPTTYWGETLIKVDPTARYTISGRAANLTDSEERPLGFVSFDIDKKLIEALHVTKYGFAADTTLAAPVTPGDTSILVTNASGWSNDASDSAGTRSLAWYGYTDSTGHTYSNYTYTRNIAFDLDTGLWRPGAIHYDATAGAYRINLINPWTGPVLASGAAIRNAASGDARNKLRTSPAYDPRHESAEFAATAGGGVWQDGQRNEETFRPGTAYIEPLFTNTTPTGNLTIAPTGNVAPVTSAALPSDHHVDLDLDVLAKIVSGIQLPSGDYNRNGIVDSADYVLWRKTSGTTGLTPFIGADGNGDGKIDQADYQFWRANEGHANTLVIESVAPAQHGTASVVTAPNGSPVIHYHSDPWFVGTDVIPYTLRNTVTNEIKSSSVTIQVLGGSYQQNPSLIATLTAQAQTAGNVPPLATDDFYDTAAGQTLVADGFRQPSLLEFDTDGTNKLVTRLLSGPTHGTLTLNYDGTFAYTPEPGYVGTDSFRYEAFDGQFTDPAVANVTVRSTSEDVFVNRLRSVGIAMLNYNSSLKRLPITNTASYFDANGNPYLSWRVHVLPYFGYQSLYNQFHLSEPWNSPNNLPLADKMPDIFRNPGDAATTSTTRLSILSAEGAPYYWRRSAGLLVGPTLSNFTDGTSNSFLVVETGANKAVTWTKPDQMNFDPNNPLAALGTLSSNNFHAVMADASTITLPASIDADTFKSFVTISGGELNDAGTLRREYTETTGGQAALQSFNTSTTNLKTITLGMLNYADSKKAFPVIGSTYFDANGNPYLSWRVHILPYIEQTVLYNKFHLDEPWDSPNNLPLLAEMPDIFRSPGDSAASTTTRYMTFTGPDAPFGYRTPGQNQTGPSYAQITDGTSQTILFAEAGPDKAVDWTRPDDMPFDRNNPLASLGDISAGKFRAAFFDGHIATLGSDIAPVTFAALVTRNRQELIDASTVAEREAERGLLPAPAATTINDFKTIDLATQNYSSSRSRLPASSFDSTGKPLLSWRVLILPFIEQGALYNQFHFNEPWDSPNNLALLNRMPDFYRSAGDPWDSSSTRVQGFTGTNAPFPTQGTNSAAGITVQSITDGTSNTIMFAEGGSPVPWTKPTDMPLDLNNPLSPLGDVGPNFVTAFFDGHIATQLSSISLGLLKAYITYKGGEIITSPPSLTSVPGVYVSQSAGNTSLNEFGVDAIDVVLEKAPQSNVVVCLTSSDTNIATMDKPTLTFTPANWNLPQSVAVRGVDNHTINPDQLVNITVAVVAALSDNQYDPLAPQTFAATVLNDDFASGDYNHSGLADQTDYDTWRANFGANANAALAADGNFNGTVDASDYVLWRKILPAPASGTELAAQVTTRTAMNAEVQVTVITEQVAAPLEAAFAHWPAALPSLSTTHDEVTTIAENASTTLDSDPVLNKDKLLLADTRLASDRAITRFEVSPSKTEAEQPGSTDLALASAFDQAWRKFG